MLLEERPFLSLGVELFAFLFLLFQVLLLLQPLLAQFLAQSFVRFVLLFLLRDEVVLLLSVFFSHCRWFLCQNGFEMNYYNKFEINNWD